MQKVLFPIASLVLSLMLVGVMPLASAQNSTQTTTTLPNWIKKNAKWWAEGLVEDKDFVQGIQYLIQKGIMKIPETNSSGSLSGEKIPEWIKSNAGWWADNKISDGDFVSEIQYLINKGIMKVNPSPTPSKKQPSGYY